MRIGNPWRALSVIALLALVAVACTPSAPPSPTAAPPKPAAPTSAPAATAAPAAKPAPAATAAPKEAAKPTEKPAEKAAPKTTITLRGLSSWERNISFTQPFLWLIDRIKTKTNGELQITYAGPEVVPAFEVMNAVSKGVYDIVHSAPSYYVPNAPAATAYQYLQVPCQKYREAGVIDLLDQMHRQLTNTTFLGCAGGNNGFTFTTKDPVTSLDYFKGKKIRADQTRVPIVEALGAAAVVIPPADVYSAMERKIVDGIVYPETGILERKWDEVAKYMLKPSWMDVKLNFVMNVDAFNKLPPNLQKALLDTIREMEPEAEKYYADERTKEHTELQKKGVQFTTLSPADSEKLLKIVEDAIWGQIEKSSPDWGPKMRTAYAKLGAR